MPDTEQAVDAAASSASAAAWAALAEVVSVANEGDFQPASNPTELAEWSDWVLRANISPPKLSRSFSTVAEPDVLVYETIGFDLADVEILKRSAASELSQNVVAEVVAPVKWSAEEMAIVEKLQPTSVLVFGDDFTLPDPKTTVARGGDSATTYLGVKTQGLVVETEEGLLSIADGTSDFLTKEYGLTTIDQVLAWWKEGTELPTTVD